MADAPCAFVNNVTPLEIAQISADAPKISPDAPPPDVCVICLDTITEQAAALPCHHSQFDFLCLGTWTQQSSSCPLCKAEIKAIKFKPTDASQGQQVLYLPDPACAQPSAQDGRERRLRRRNHRRHHSNLQRHPGHTPSTQNHHIFGDQSLQFRLTVYHDRKYSLHVGSNRISQYRNITPALFASDETLTSRARSFIRRELKVFEFLDPSFSTSSRSTTNNSRWAMTRRTVNAEYLLQYIVAILKAMDVRGSKGQAEELLSEFLGRENARLFLHELNSWLRSPYERLEDWDRHVQYAVDSHNEFVSDA